MLPLGYQQQQVYQQPVQQMRPEMRAPGAQQLQPFGPMSASPFDMMDQMLRPMGTGNLLGGIFSQVDQMMRHMDGLGADSMMPIAAGGSQVMMMNSSGGAGTYSSNTMVISSTLGPDGQVHTERYCSSGVGDHGRQISELQQAYSNSSNGIDKMSLERQMQDQGRKVVKERNRFNGEERSTTLFRGIDEDQAADFDGRWQGHAAPHLPGHCQQLMLAGGNFAQQRHAVANRERTNRCCSCWP